MRVGGGNGAGTAMMSAQSASYGLCLNIQLLYYHGGRLLSSVALVCILSICIVGIVVFLCEIMPLQII